MPRELEKTTLPPYRLEPPDILVVEAVHLVPKAPYRMRSSDVLTINVQGTLPDAPIAGPYVIEPGGVVNLGLAYGSVLVAGMSREEAELAIEKQLKTTLKAPTVAVSVASMAGLQQVAGQHLVGPDGTLNLGTYGSVFVVGMTLADTKKALETHLEKYLENPEVSVDVYSYNSKAYYVITAGAGTGDQVVKFPITGNETVLDALAQVGGMQDFSSKRLWIARPTNDNSSVQVLPVDWMAVSAQGVAATNYQLLPGDRLYIAEDDMVAIDTRLGKLLAPFQRIMGFTTQSVGTISRLTGKVLMNQNNNFNRPVIIAP